MALYMPNPPTTWDRTLPKPAALLPNGFQELPRRNSSLLQHHIGSEQFLTPAADESARRNTVAFLPARPEAGHEKGPVEEEYSTHRSTSIMSNESITTSSSEDTSPQEPSSGYCLCVPEPKIPRPRNAFILYRQHQHAGVVAQHPGLPNPDISKIIGEQWRRLPFEDKNEWKALAEQEKARHSQQFPDYRYRPKRSGRFQSQEGQPSNQPQASNCAKCGGKTMNPPHTPQYTSFGHNGMVPVVGISRSQKRGYSEAQAQPPRPQPMIQVAPPPPPYTAPIRYGFGSISAPRHDSVHYAAPSPHAPAEGPDAKRRRLNSPYPARLPYDVPYYTDNRDRPIYRPEQLPRQSMPPPPVRAGHATPPSQASPRGPQPSQTRRDLNLTLAPLKTGNGQSRLATLPNTQSQASSMEAMIMSYPVLTKLKTLSSVTPTLAAPGPTSPPFEVRGTIIAIEGLDEARVFDMTHSLAEQLGKEAKFDVRIFTGPDPYHALQTSRRASIGEKGGVFMTAASYLSLMSEWHKVSKELVDFITHRPRTRTVEDATDQEMTDASQEHVLKQQNQNPFEREQNKSSRPPISAISPGTIEQTADMSINSPQTVTVKDKDDKNNDSSTTPSTPRVTRSRVPAWQQNKQEENEAQAQSPPGNTSEPISSLIPLPPSSHPPTPPPLSPSATPSPKTNQSQPSSQPQIPTKIPVALVPHYQLTTVDTCSIALPITDNYDPLTHWRWHATLWRGCVGPDISVVIKSLHEQYEDDATDSADAKRQSNASDAPRRTGSIAAGVSGPPPQPREVQIPGSQENRPAPPPFGVEVRLQDHRAVIVRAAAAGKVGASVGEMEREKENENWEKAKRRVGFEVEESLRR